MRVLEGSCGCAHPGRWIADVAGRLDDTFVYGTATLHPHASRSALAATPWAVGYQVRQTARGARVIVDASGDPIAPEAVRALEAAFALQLERVGLRAPEVEVVLSESLQRHGKTGKLKRFVPLDVPEDPSPRGSRPP